VETPTQLEQRRQEAIAIVTKIGDQYGYGDMIFNLKNAWAAMLLKTEGFDQLLADNSVGHICPWCDTDGRTGQKAASSNAASVAAQRPSDHEELSAEDQWAVDKRLGILDWDGN